MDIARPDLARKRRRNRFLLVLVRKIEPPATIVNGIRGIVRELDPKVEVSELRTMTEMDL